MKKYNGSEQHKENAKLAREKAKIRSAELKQERINEYYKNPKLCLHCNKPIDYYKKRTNKFCSSSCAAISNNTGSRHTEETKAKIKASSIKGSSPTILLLFCKFCKKEYEVSYKTHSRRKNRQFCSIECRKFFNKSPEGREIRSKISKKAIAEGKNKGWAYRRFEPSYPEKYFTKVLDTEKLEYVYEHKVGKFFIDFALLDKKIALEVDGSQHTYPEHIERDARKDKFLVEQGWTVFRIKWVNPINDKNKQILYPQIDNFRKLIYS